MVVRSDTERGNERQSGGKLVWACFRFLQSLGNSLNARAEPVAPGVGGGEGSQWEVRRGAPGGSAFPC